MSISESLLEVKEYTGEGYKPLIDYDKWRVAVLKYCDELLPENITKMQRHDETDEVFVLLQGKFMLFIGEGKDKVENIHGVWLEPLKFYNVKKGVYHTHSLSDDAVVLIVENRDTVLENSPEIELTEEQRKALVSLYNR
ncbi:hypothetical protein [Clostridium thermarum]|uniref:hypothetical protein n=1 Tax=Clostridium thermarum TaxID=1716543 RepID=UPI001123757C|nr:hypothetical protein [Clostridium thermarum]